MVAPALRELFTVAPGAVEEYVSGHRMLREQFDVAAAARLAAGLPPDADLDALGAGPWTKLGTLHLLRGEIRTAVTALTRAARLGDPGERINAELFLGIAHQEAGDRMLALEAFERVIAADAAGASAEVSQAVCQALFEAASMLQEDQPERAIRLYARAGEDPGRLGRMADFNRGIVLAARGDRTTAAAAYRRAVTATDADIRANAANNLGNLLSAGDPVEAERAFLIGIAAGLADSANNLGNMHRDLGNPVEAIAAYEIAVGMSDADQRARALANIGEVHVRQGRAAEARVAYLRSIEIRESVHSWRARFDLGCLQAALHETGAARRQWEICLDAPDPEIVAVARDCLAALTDGSLRAAEEACEEQNAADPGADRLAVQLLATANWSDARTMLLADEDRIPAVEAALARRLAQAEADDAQAEADDAQAEADDARVEADGDARVEADGDAGTEGLRQHHRQVVRCREVGVDAAFAEISDLHGLAADGMVVQAVALTDAMAAYDEVGTHAEAAFLAASGLLADPRWPDCTAEFRARVLVMSVEALSMGGRAPHPDLHRRIIAEMRELLRAHPGRFLGLLPHNLAQALVQEQPGVRRTLADAAEAVELLESLVFAPAAAADGRAVIHSQLAVALARRGAAGSATASEDLRRAVALGTTAVRELDEAEELGPAMRLLVRRRLADVYATCADVTGDGAARDQSIGISRRLHAQADEQGRPATAYDLANQLLRRDELGDATEAVALLDEVAAQLPIDSPLRDQVDFTLCLTIMKDATAFPGGDGRGVQRVAALLRRRMAVDPSSALHRSRTASLLVRLFEHTGDARLVTAAVDLCEQSLRRATAPRDVQLATQVLAMMLGFQHEATGDLTALRRSAELFAGLLGEASPLASRAELLGQYGAALTALGLATGDLAYLDQAVDVLADGRLDGAAPELTRRLAFALEHRGNLHHVDGDLREAVTLHRRMLDATGPRAAQRWRRIGDLATAQLRLHNVDRTDAVLSEAIGNLRSAVDDRTTPDPDIRMMSNLALALLGRYKAHGAGADLDEAIERIERCLSAANPDSALRPAFLGVLGNALALRSDRDGRPDDVHRATATFRAACRAAAELGGELRQAALAWAHWAGRRSAWAEVAEAADAGLANDHTLLQAQLSPAHQQASRALSGNLSSLGAYAHSRLGDHETAAVTLERGLAAMLTAALHREPEDLDRLTELGHGDLAARYREHVAAVNGVERLLDPASPPPPERGAAVTGHWTTPLRKRRAALAEVVADIRAVDGFADFLAAPRPAAIAAAAAAQPLVYLLCTPWGGVALTVVTEPGRPVAFGHIDLPYLTEKLVHQFAVMLVGTTGRAMMQAIELAVCVLSRSVMESVLAATRLPAEPAVTLIPAGPLSYLPLHAALVSVDDEDNARYVLDDVRVTYAPNARALVPAARRAARPPGRLLVVDNPEPATAPLLTTAEVAAARRRFPEHTYLAGNDATVARVLQLVPHHDVLHFACHGVARLDEPLRSALRLAGGRPLDLGQLLNVRIDARLAVLSACSTTVSGLRQSYESVNLASAFLASGAGGVIAALWPVPDAATNALMAAFYRRWTGTTAPDEALRQAQRWLRAATNEEIDAEFPGAVGRPPAGAQARPLWAGAVAYEHPYYWAGFTYTGR